MVFQCEGHVDEVQEPDRRGRSGESVATAVGEKILWSIQY